MDIKKHSCKLAVFAINLLILILVVFGIKEKETGKFSMENTTEEKIVPVDGNILETQNRLAAARESKLRDLNSAPKSITQKNITTTSTTVVPDAAPKPTTSKTADKKTKTS